MIYLIISNIIFLFLFIFFIIKYFRLLNNKKDFWYDHLRENITKILFEERDKKQKEIELELKNYELSSIGELDRYANKLTLQIEKKQEEYDNLSKYFNDLEVQGKDRIDKQLKDYETIQKRYINERLDKDDEEREEQLIQNYLYKRNQYQQQNDEFAASLSKELEQIKTEIEGYKEKRQAINEEILRQRELSEKETFYSINLTENEIQDIIYLQEFENKFTNKEVLAKAIYESYYKKPLAEMIKRVTKGEEFSGIYKITYKPTGEIYIGRAVNVGKRWVEHIKSSLGIGTLVSSTLHKRLKSDGCWNFTFEVLEKVPKDELAKRESYWINFYESNIYGMNMRKEIAGE